MTRWEGNLGNFFWGLNSHGVASLKQYVDIRAGRGDVYRFFGTSRWAVILITTPRRPAEREQKVDG